MKSMQKSLQKLSSRNEKCDDDTDDADDDADRQHDPYVSATLRRRYKKLPVTVFNEVCITTILIYTYFLAQSCSFVQIV